MVRCDEAPWRFLGLSLAGYNALMSLALVGIAAWAAALEWWRLRSRHSFWHEAAEPERPAQGSLSEGKADAGFQMETSLLLLGHRWALFAAMHVA
jgi:Disulfide bond formation protein DsbB